MVVIDLVVENASFEMTTVGNEALDDVTGDFTVALMLYKSAQTLGKS
jgi:hypothetical protein